MHSAGSRANAFSSPVFVLVGAMIAVSAITSYMFHAPPTATIHFNSVEALNKDRLDRNDQAKIRFDISVDLRPAWDWNVKNVYIGVLGDISSASIGSNASVMIWDTVLSDRRNDSQFSRLAVTPKYPLKDIFNRFRGADVTLRVVYSLFPYAGKMISGTIASDSFTLPSDYSTRMSEPQRRGN
mmetsp:Transcript_10388/g.21882  ORF Transcript_10388/g.21882 Transcript_10388/m.21882 type:complete len:183 (-) Transcript_10388:2345-2893(-)